MFRSKLIMSSLLVLAVALAGCGGGGGSKVKASALEPRLLPDSAIPGFTLERKLDWTDPVNLIGEGIQIPEVLHPSQAVAVIDRAHFEGAAGEILRKGSGLNANEVRIGVAKFKSAGDATTIRTWMHKQDLQQPCFSECAFSPQPTALAGAPGTQFVIQKAALPPPPPGAPAGAKPPPGVTGPANYLAEFTFGPYLYWVALQADQSAKGQVEAGIKAYYQRAKHEPV
jgi:hypothetical protein